MNVPLLDLKGQYAAIKAEVDAAVAEVMESQHFILGPKVEACEKAVALYSNTAYGIGVSSGSDALLACLMAEQIGPGDEVVTPPYTFFATAGAVARAGATPECVAVDPATSNLHVSQHAPRPCAAFGRTARNRNTITGSSAATSASMPSRRPSCRQSCRISTIGPKRAAVTPPATIASSPPPVWISRCRASPPSATSSIS